MQGPPEAADRSTKFHKICNIKAVFLSAKSKPASMEVLYEGTFVPGEGGYLVYFADGMCTSFRVSFSAIDSKAGYLFC